jgi:hypothetical protein
VVERLKASDMQEITDFMTAITSAKDSYTPTLTNITVGTTGTSVGVYKQIGKKIEGSVVITFNGTGMSNGTAPSITLPVAPHARYISASALGLPAGTAELADTGTGNWKGSLMVLSGSTATIFYHTEAGGGGLTQISAGTPYTVAATDVWRLSFAYDAA